MTLLRPDTFLGGGNGAPQSLGRFLLFFFESVYRELCSTDFSVFTIKRQLWLAAFGLAVPLLMVWNHLGFFLDDIFYPQWRYQKVKDPMFIVGNARSGTTFVHRVLASTSRSFTYFRTWEILFGSSVTWNRGIRAIYAFDQTFLFGMLTACVELCEHSLIGKGGQRKALHRVGLQLAEEDEWLMAHICKSQLMLMFFPVGAYLSELVLFDRSDKLSDATRSSVIHFYRTCVQRHLYARGEGKTFLSKNPPFTMRLESLHKAFPSARFAVMVRDPVESIPSFVSYIGTVWHTFSSPLPMYPDHKQLFEFALAHYEEPLRVLVGDGVVPDGSGALIFPSNEKSNNVSPARQRGQKEREQEGREKEAPGSVSRRSRAHRRSSTPRLHSNSWIGRGTSVLRDETARVDYDAVARVVNFGEDHEEEEDANKDAEDQERAAEADDNEKAASSKRPLLSQWTFVKYAHLKTDLKQTIKKALARLQLRAVIDDELLQAQEDTARSYRSSHVHSSVQCCAMSEDELRGRFQTVLDRIDFGVVESEENAM